MAVDAAAEIIEVASRLQGGEAVALGELAALCHNVEDDGRPRPNRNLLDAATLADDLARYRRLTGHEDWMVSGGQLRWTARDALPAPRWLCGPAPEALPGPVPALFCGTLTVNLAKFMGPGELLAWARRVRAFLSPEGSAVFGLTPLELLRPEPMPAILADAGFEAAGWFFETLVLRAAEGEAPAGLHGDIAWLGSPASGGPFHSQLERTLERLCFEGVIAAAPPDAGELVAELGARPRASAWRASVEPPAGGILRWTRIEDALVPALLRGEDP
jgi:hypothetical protein